MLEKNDYKFVDRVFLFFTVYIHGVKGQEKEPMLMEVSMLYSKLVIMDEKRVERA